MATWRGGSAGQEAHEPYPVNNASLRSTSSIDTRGVTAPVGSVMLRCDVDERKGRGSVDERVEGVVAA
jgi:hypothetical protein